MPATYASKLGCRRVPDEPIDLIHDIGLFVFEGAWAALGVALLRAERQRRPATASALV